MTLKEKKVSDFDAGVSRGTGEEHGTEGKNRWAGVLLVLVGVLMIAISTRGAGLGDDATPGSSGGDHLAKPEGRKVIRSSSDGDVVAGGGGDDEIYGGPGHDLLVGGPGDDFIEANDGERDYVSCGPGYDVVDADNEDYVAGDCEIVYRR